LVGYKKATPSGPSLLSRLIITGLLGGVTLVPSVFPNGTNGSNINAAPAVPTIFKKSRREKERFLDISHNNSTLEYIKHSNTKKISSIYFPASYFIFEILVRINSLRSLASSL
jgi:hypothetical protein